MATKITDQNETTVINGAFVITEKEDAVEFEKVDLQTVVDKATDYTDAGAESIAESCGLDEKAVAVGDPPEWETSADAESNYMTADDFTDASLDVNLKNRTKLLDTALGNIQTEVTAIEIDSQTITAAADDEDSGTATSVGEETVIDSGAAWEVDGYAGFVCLLEEDGVSECALIISNTSTELTFDENLTETFTTPNYRILDTTTITSENEQVIACYTDDNDCAIVLPTVSSLNDRKNIEIYIESGDNKVYIVAPVENKLKLEDTIKWFYLAAINELADIKPHNVTGSEHFDVTNLVFLQSFLSTYTTSDYTTTATTEAQNITVEEGTTVDYTRRFQEITDIDTGFNKFVYQTPKKRIFSLTANMIIEKSGEPGAGEVSIFFRKNGIALNREATSYFGDNNGTDTLCLNDIVELENGDYIDVWMQRTSGSGTYKVLTGSSIIIKD